jgi:hypothetical protein
MALVVRFVLFIGCFVAGTIAFGQSVVDTPLQAVAHFVTGQPRESGYLRSMSRADVVREFAPLIKSEPVDSTARIVAAFALAYKGVDVDQNLGRMMGPLRRFESGAIAELSPSTKLAGHEVLLEDIPNAVYRIYKARRYMPALKLMFTMPVDGAAAENRDDDVMEQLAKDPKPVLELASDAKIYEKLWDIVDWNVGTGPERDAFIRKMKSTRWPNKNVKAVAGRLARDLSKQKNRTP